MRTLFGRAAGTCLMLLLAACGGGGGDEAPAPSTFTIGGTVTGLAAGQQVTLNNNGGNPATVTANGTFTFSNAVASGGSYAVTVGTQPAGQTCTVSNGSGAGVVANIANVSVTCSTNTFTIGGTVTGLGAGKQVTLSNNAANPTTVSANGAFSFSTAVASGGSYAVTVTTQPAGQTCTVSNGTGAGVVADVTNVTVTCSTSTFTIGGTVTGLATGQQVTLNNNASNPTTVTSNGTFTFSTRVALNGSYAVTVGTQPVGQTCTVSPNGTGSGVTNDVTDITVTCSASVFNIGGTVSGLAAGRQVTLNNNGSNPTTVTTNGPFTFSTPVAFNGSFAVTVGTQPIGQTCTVSPNGTGSGVTGHVTNITVTCSANSYTIGGNVTGLGAGKQVTLNNNAGNPTTVTTNGPFTFSTAVASGGSYVVTVGTQPTGQTCTVSSGTGTVVATNITNVTVTCSTNTFTIAGTVSGLDTANSQQVTLNNNGGNPTTVSANGSFSFSTPVAFGSSYSVTIGTQATAQNCSVDEKATGSNVTAPVIDVKVTCRTVYAYVANRASNSVSQYKVGAGGALSPLPAASAATGAVPRAVAVDPKGRFAYVANGDDGSVSQYTIGSNGALTPIPLAPASVPTGTSATSQPRGVTVDPTGNYVYVANFGDDNVSQFSINQTTGALTKIGDTATGVRPFFVSVHPSGLYAYVGNFWDTTISQYNIGANGALAAMTPAATVTVGTTGGQAGDNPLAVTIDPQGKYAYVTLYGVTAKKVRQYTVGATGALTVTVGSTDVTTGNNPWPMVITPSGLNAYWSNIFDDQIAQFSINVTTGALTALTPQPTVNITPNPANPAVMAIDSTGRYAYVANSGNGSVSQFAIGAGGALGPIGAGSVAAGAEPIGIALTR